MNANDNLMDRFERTAFGFLMADTDLGITMSRIAHDTQDEQKKQRNQHNARRAYDAVVRHSARAPLTDDQAAQLQDKVDQLKSALTLLGEQF